MMLRPAVNRYGLDRNGRKDPCHSSWERGSLTDFHFESSSPFGPATLLIYDEQDLQAIHNKSTTYLASWCFMGPSNFVEFMAGDGF